MKLDVIWECDKARFRVFYIFSHSSFSFVFVFFSDDHSRVVLTGRRETPGSDYINANYVDVRLLFYRIDNNFLMSHLLLHIFR